MRVSISSVIISYDSYVQNQLIVFEINSIRIKRDFFCFNEFSSKGYFHRITLTKDIMCNGMYSLLQLKGRIRNQVQAMEAESRV